MTCCGKKSGDQSRYAFRPDYSLKPLTEKFYARHEHLVIVQPVPENVALYESEIDKRLHHDPRNESYAPRTENQVYGWLERLAPRYVSVDDQELMVYPKKTDEVMSVMHKIAVDLAMERRIFGGTR